MWDVLVTDQTMPRVKGSDLVRAFRRYNGGVSIICTGYGIACVAQEMAQAQPDAILRKPFEVEHLIHLIDELIAKVRKSGPCGHASSE